MDEKIVIKQEPLDYDDNEQETYSSEFANDFEHHDRIIRIKVENEDLCIVKPASLDEIKKSFPVVEEQSNKITILAAKSIKTEDERSFIKEIIDEAFSPKKQIAQDEREEQKMKLDCNCSTLTALECCQKCGKSFETLTQRTSHENRDHRVARKTKCNICKKNFNTFLELTRHMTEHRDERRYVCSHCFLCCSSYQELQDHWSTSEKCINVFTKELKNSVQQRRIALLKNYEYQESSQPQNNIGIESRTFFDKNVYSNEQAVSIEAEKKPMSYADEVKLMTARYQLKSSAVAEKRTSSITTDMVNCGKKRKTLKVNGNGPVLQHTTPMVISNENNFSDPLLDVKIKDEPCDIQDDGQLPIQLEEIEIKSEPIDDHEYLSQTEPICELHVDNSFSEDMTHVSKTVEAFQKNKVPIINNLKHFNMLKSAGLKHKAVIMNVSPMKNIKIFKLAPNAKIVKIPPNEKVKLKPIENNSTKQQFTASFVPVQSQLPESSPKKHKFGDEIKDDQDCKAISAREFLETVIIRGNSGKRINSVPKSVLQYIENQPDKLKIIKELQAKIKLAEKGNKLSSIDDTVHNDNSTLEEDNENTSISSTASKISTSLSVSSPTGTVPPEPTDSPSSLFSKFSKAFDVELKNARLLHRNYRYVFICPICPIQYEKKYVFQEHLTKEHCLPLDELTFEVRPYSMQHCVKVKKSTKQISSINNQSQGKTNGKAAKECVTSYQCLKCELNYSSRTMLNEHLRADCSRSPQYSCTVCNKSFYSASTLKCHATIHTGELPHKCNYCEKRFRTKGQVNVHHRTHTGEKPFNCQVCSQSFTHRETLISHISRHIGMKRYKCYGCNKRFACVSGLKTHRDVRPDSCGRVKLNTRAVGPRVRVVRGIVHFEPQPTINPYLRDNEPSDILGEIQNLQRPTN